MDTGYIVEGSSFEGQVRDTNTSIDLGPELPEVDFDGTGPMLTNTPRCADEFQGDTCNNYYPTEQEWLKQKAQGTTTTSDELWKHFPEGGSGPSPSTSNPRKDPLATFLDSPLSP